LRKNCAPADSFISSFSNNYWDKPIIHPNSPQIEEELKLRMRLLRTAKATLPIIIK
jgi:hypothetical protein